MRLEDIKLDALTQVPRVKDRTKTYFDPNFYYKIWDYHHTAFHTQVGLDRIYMGMDELASVKVGLINDATCHAYAESIYDDNGVCRGYIMHRGLPVENEDDLANFTSLLAEHSLRAGHAMVDVNIHNVIVYDGKCSLIDIDCCPIKLLHGKTLSEVESDRWFTSFYNPDRIYFNQLLNGIAQGKCQ